MNIALLSHGLSHCDCHPLTRSTWACSIRFLFHYRTAERGLLLILHDVTFMAEARSGRGRESRFDNAERRASEAAVRRPVPSGLAPSCCRAGDWGRGASLIREVKDAVPALLFGSDDGALGPDDAWLPAFPVPGLESIKNRGACPRPALPQRQVPTLCVTGGRQPIHLQRPRLPPTPQGF
jgi:hypothetical protein